EDVAASAPDLFANGTTADLVELVADESDNPTETPRLMPFHARVRSSRSVFRRFVRVPGGADAVRALVEGTPRSVHLPMGSFAALVESPLVISREGRLVAFPMITLAETRRVRPLPQEPQLADLGFDVLDGHRASLRGAPPHLDRLAPGAPFPSTGSCGHDA